MSAKHTPEQISEADIDIALRKLRMEIHVAGGSSGTIRLIDDILLSCLPLGRLAEILTDAVAQRREHSEPDEGRKDAGSTPVSILLGMRNAIFVELGEPDYKLARWSHGAEPWHYWSRESIEAAIAKAEGSSHA